MNLIAAGKITITGPTQLSTLRPATALSPSGGVKKLRVSASDTQVGKVLVGGAGLTASGADGICSLSPPSGALTDRFDIEDHENEGYPAQYSVVPLNGSDTVYLAVWVA